MVVQFCVALPAKLLGKLKQFSAPQPSNSVQVLSAPDLLLTLNW